MSTDIVLIVAAVVLIAVGALFAAIDAALLTVSLARVDDLVREERPGAKRLRTLLSNRPLYINLSVLTRITCEVVATVLVVVVVQSWLPLGWAATIAAVVMVMVSYIGIGVGPRTLGRQHAYSIATGSAFLLTGIAVLAGPITRVLILLGNAVTPGKGFRNGPFATEVEVREIVDLAQQSGAVADDERRMIQSVFELGDTMAREVMVPRPEMIWIESTKSVRQAINLATRSGHSRIPVIGENVDDVLGVVYLKDMVALPEDTNRGAVQVLDVIKPARIVPDIKPLDALLKDMQLTHNHMAVLVNEYGSVAGLVTIEDVLEEIVGEIADEYDDGEIAPITDLGEGRYRVSARLPLEDLGELYGIAIDEEEVDTVGGLIGLVLGRVPLPGAEVTTYGLHLHAHGDADRRHRVRITTVDVDRLPTDDADNTDADGPEPAQAVSGRRGDRTNHESDES